MVAILEMDSLGVGSGRWDRKPLQLENGEEAMLLLALIIRLPATASGEGMFSAVRSSMLPRQP